MIATMTKKEKILTMLVIFAMVVMSTFVLFYFGATTVFAAETTEPGKDIFKEVGTQFNTIFIDLGIIVSALAGIAMAVCALKLILAGSDQQGARSARAWLFRIAAGLAIYWLAFLAIDKIKSMTSGYNTLDYIQNIEGITGQ